MSASITLLQKKGGGPAATAVPLMLFMTLSRNCVAFPALWQQPGPQLQMINLRSTAVAVSSKDFATWFDCAELEMSRAKLNSSGKHEGMNCFHMLSSKDDGDRLKPQSPAVFLAMPWITCHVKW